MSDTLAIRPTPRMLADVDRAASDVDVGVAKSGQELWQGDAVGVELVEIDFDIVRLGRAAPGYHLDHSGNRQQPALHDPVLKRTKIGQAQVRRPDQLIAVDFADQARALNVG